MKHKLGAAIATILAVAITGATVVAQNQPSNSPEGLPNQTRLNLTDEQRTQMRQIRQETRAQMENVLTAEQREKLKAGMSQERGRRNMQAVMSQLDLTQEQKDKIKQIQQSSRQRMQSILTSEQLQQMQQMRQNRQNRSNNSSNL